MILGLGFLINLSFNVNLFLKILLPDLAFLLISDLEKEKVHDGADVKAVIMKTEVPGQEGANVACDEISKWKARLKEDMDVRSDVYVLSNDGMVFSCGCKAEIRVTKGLLVKAKGNILGLEIIKDRSVSGHIYAIGSQEYQVICTRPNITTASMDMLDGFDRGLQINVQVFVDFDYAIGRSITVMSRSIIGYGLMILGCAGSWKANLQHLKALSTTEVDI
uniref:Zinc finger, CCHC-type n=1 Tax=Tanacetum cinerariifolium TaxID=118510 RepID=A0A6L2MDG4_TANCI|nr:zinc finger, CCHC-type [Tanacetum cinerariifolium]